MTDHPITPPPELAQKRFNQAELAPTRIHCIATRAAQWGADQELQACCEVVSHWYGDWVNGINLPIMLRAARRPKPPPSLAEQGMEALRSTPCTEQRHYDALFAALNRLAELEDSND